MSVKRAQRSGACRQAFVLEGSSSSAAEPDPARTSALRTPGAIVAQGSARRVSRSWNCRRAPRSPRKPAPRERSPQASSPSEYIAHLTATLPKDQRFSDLGASNRRPTRIDAGGRDMNRVEQRDRRGTTAASPHAPDLRNIGTRRPGAAAPTTRNAGSTTRGWDFVRRDNTPLDSTATARNVAGRSARRQQQPASPRNGTCDNAAPRLRTERADSRRRHHPGDQIRCRTARTSSTGASAAPTRTPPSPTRSSRPCANR